MKKNDTITIENKENASKFEIVKAGEDNYTVTYYEYLASRDEWRQIGPSESYSKEAVEWEFEIKVA